MFRTVYMSRAGKAKNQAENILEELRKGLVLQADNRVL